MLGNREGEGYNAKGLRPNFPTLIPALEALLYRQKWGKRGGKMEGKPTKFPSKMQPPGYRIWGEKEAVSTLYLLQGFWPASYLGYRWPAGYFPWPAGQGSKGSGKINGRPYQKGSL